MTRSSIKPRLLFPSFDSGYGASDDVDEEAETDVEMFDAPPAGIVEQPAEASSVVATPAKMKSAPPPPTWDNKEVVLIMLFSARRLLLNM